MGKITKIHVPAFVVRLGSNQLAELHNLWGRAGGPSWCHLHTTPALRSLVKKGLVERAYTGSGWAADSKYQYRMTLKGQVVLSRLLDLETMTPIELLAQTGRETA